jgi:glycosyltransferase involved in cell wall biosynthesis
VPKSVKIIDVYKLSKETYGTDILLETVKSVNPECVLIYNDAPVISAFLTILSSNNIKIPIVSYLDLVYKYQKRELINYIISESEHVFVFSDIWKKHLIDGYGANASHVSVFPHGIDVEKFKKMDKKIAKRAIGFHEDNFIIFNNNRNSYRKLLDIGLKAFVRFWKMTGCDPRVKYLINCRLDITDGYNFHDILKNSSIEEDVDHETLVNHHVILLSKELGGCVSDDQINTALNASDVGINTCGGEGFGLCNAEGAFLGNPQIVTDVGGLSDIFYKFPNMLVEPKLNMTLTAGIDFHNGELAICDFKDVADKMFFYYSNRDVLRQDGDSVKKHIKETYSWDQLLENFDNDLRKIINDYWTRTMKII